MRKGIYSHGTLHLSISLFENVKRGIDLALYTRPIKARQGSDFKGGSSSNSLSVPSQIHHDMALQAYFISDSLVSSIMLF